MLTQILLDCTFINNYQQLATSGDDEKFNNKNSSNYRNKRLSEDIRFDNK